jgi:signal peptidase I
LSDLGIHLPPYDRKGCVFTIDSQKQFENCLPLAMLSADHISELIEKRASSAQASGDEPVWFDQFPWKWTVLAPNFAYSVGILMLVGSLFGLLIQLFNIPSGSQKPTLLVGDYISVNTLTYGINVTKDLPFDLRPGIFFREDPKRGDVVVFRVPSDMETVFVDRVVGLPGDEVQMRDGVLYINRIPVRRDRIEDFIETEEGTRSTRVKQWRETLPNGVSYTTIDLIDNGFYDNTEVYQVPAGHFFVMGDNRDNSTDSRVLRHVGYVPFENLVGRVQIIFFSIREGEYAWKVWRWPWSVRWERLFTSVR